MSCSTSRPASRRRGYPRGGVDRGSSSRAASRSGCARPTSRASCRPSTGRAWCGPSSRASISPPSTRGSGRPRATADARRSTPRSSSRSGCTPPSRGSARRGPSTACVTSTTRTAGSPAAWGSTTTPWPTSGWRPPSSSTSSSSRAWRRSSPAGEVSLARVAHDGVRVRASAGAGSYRGRRGLGRALEDATAQVAALRVELDDDPGATSRRTAAARERATRERESRVRRALGILPDLEAAKARARARGRQDRPVPEARVSTADPEARVMRMGDGGYRPAYNGQLTTDVASGLVCGVEVTNQGTDVGRLGPAIERLEHAFGRRPAEMLADGGYVSLAEIDHLAACGTVLYAPPPVRPPARDGRRQHPDSPAVAEWRARMATPEGQLLYRLRAASAEWVNALARNRGLQQYRVRGLEKIRSVLLWFALAHNLARPLAIRAGATG